MKNGVRIIFHVDMDAYFCTVEEIKSPFLRKKPFIVSTRLSTKGIVSTASYPARKYGIKSGMSKMDAIKLCPKLIVVDSDYQAYSDYSYRFMKILKEYSKLVEQASIDEAYMDVTELSKERHPVLIAKEIQSKLKEIGLSCSIGIGPTLFLAKMGSDYKKPMGISIIRKSDVVPKLYPLSIDTINGVGKKTAIVFRKIGIEKIKDFMDYDKDKLVALIGENHYYSICDKLMGKSSDVVDPNRYSVPSSMGHSTTFIKILFDEDDLKKELYILSERVSRRLIEAKMFATSIAIQIKYANFTNTTRCKTTRIPIQDAESIYAFAESLFDDNWNNQPVRLLGVTGNRLTTTNKKEVKRDLFNYEFFDES